MNHFPSPLVYAIFIHFLYQVLGDGNAECIQKPTSSAYISAQTIPFLAPLILSLCEGMGDGLDVIIQV